MGSRFSPSERSALSSPNTTQYQRHVFTSTGLLCPMEGRGQGSHKQTGLLDLGEDMLKRDTDSFHVYFAPSEHRQRPLPRILLVLKTGNKFSCSKKYACWQIVPCGDVMNKKGSSSKFFENLFLSEPPNGSYSIK